MPGVNRTKSPSDIQWSITNGSRVENTGIVSDCNYLALNQHCRNVHRHIKSGTKEAPTLYKSHVA